MASDEHRPRVFIGSSTEQLKYARAVQEALAKDYETTVWDQQVFGLSEYPLESLFKEVDLSDFGVFVLAPEDLIQIRGEAALTPRDNVVFELGMFIGKLGRERTFILRPRTSKRVHFPSDLTGITYGEYETGRQDENLVAAMGPACNRLRRKMSGPPSTHLDSMVPYRLFREYKGIFDMLLGSSKTITLYFIHSRRWREDHIDELRGFLTRRGTSMTVFLPDLENTLLIDAIKSHFDDGPYIPAYIADAYSAYLDLRKHYKRRVKICLFSIYPTYSIYKFDDKIIAAMYPTTLARKSVPSFHFGEASRIGAFVADDLNRMMKESRKPRDSELAELASRYQDSGIRKKRGR